MSKQAEIKTTYYNFNCVGALNIKDPAKTFNLSVYSEKEGDPTAQLPNDGWARDVLQFELKAGDDTLLFRTDDMVNPYAENPKKIYTSVKKGHPTYSEKERKQYIFDFADRHNEKHDKVGRYLINTKINDVDKGFFSLTDVIKYLRELYNEGKLENGKEIKVSGNLQVTQYKGELQVNYNVNYIGDKRETDELGFIYEGTVIVTSETEFDNQGEYGILRVHALTKESKKNGGHYRLIPLNLYYRPTIKKEGDTKELMVSRVEKQIENKVKDGLNDEQTLRLKVRGKIKQGYSQGELSLEDLDDDILQMIEDGDLTLEDVQSTMKLSKIERELTFNLVFDRVETANGIKVSIDRVFDKTLTLDKFKEIIAKQVERDEANGVAAETVVVEATSTEKDDLDGVDDLFD